MKARNIVVSLAVLAAAAGGAYWYRQHQEAAQTPVPAAGSGSAAIAVVTAPAEQVTFPIRRRSIGVVETPASVVVRSRIDSQILQQHVTDGQMVKEGDLLFTLDDKEIRATIARDEAQLAKDKALRDRTAADLKRVTDLLAKNASSRQQVDVATAEAKSAEATVAADQATLENDRIRLSYTRITAPMAGRIGAVRVAPGNLVSASDSSGTGLVTITQVKPVRVATTLPERDLPLVRAAFLRKPLPPVRVYQPGTTTVLASAPADFLDSSVDTASGTIVVKATYVNDDLRLWPGMYVDVEIDLDTRPATTVVPTVAMQIGQNGPYVFVVTPEKKVELRNVAVIGADGGRTALASGIKPGEHVVVDGQLRVTHGSRVDETFRDTVPAQPQGEASISREDRT